jgi:hypothetical protein
MPRQPVGCPGELSPAIALYFVQRPKFKELDRL